MASFSLPVPKSNKWVGGMGELRYDGWLGMVELRLVEICLRLECWTIRTWKFREPLGKSNSQKSALGRGFSVFSWVGNPAPSHQLLMCSFLKGSYDVKHATKCNTFCGASSQCRHWCRSHCISLWPEDLSQKGDISRVCHGTSMPCHCKTWCVVTHFIFLHHFSCGDIGILFWRHTHIIDTV